MRPALIQKTSGAFSICEAQSIANVINYIAMAGSTIASSFNAKCEAAGGRAVHLQIVHFAI
jgi:hypothetical protein